MANMKTMTAKKRKLVYVYFSARNDKLSILSLGTRRNYIAFGIRLDAFFFSISSPLYFFIWMFLSYQPTVWREQKKNVKQFTLKCHLYNSISQPVSLCVSYFCFAFMTLFSFVFLFSFTALKNEENWEREIKKEAFRQSN